MRADRLSEHVSQKTYKGCIFAPVSHWKGGSDVSLPCFCFQMKADAMGIRFLHLKKPGLLASCAHLPTKKMNERK